jgi:hypothetical protein
MAITWRNIGQSSNQGNSLISGAADTINRGLGQIRGAAREVSQEQIRQYDTQADLNTANILNQIQSSDEGGLSSFNIDDLSSSFGSQFDAGAITSALGDRTNQLRTIARQANQDQLAQDSFDLDKQRTNSTIALNQQRANLAANEANKIQQSDKYTAKVLGDLGQYASAEDARRQILKNAPEGINASAIADQAANQWNAAIGTSKYAPIFTQVAEAGQQQVDTLASNALEKLDTQARAQGLTPALIGMKDNTEVDINAVKANYNERIADSGAPWKEDSVEPLIKKFTEKFKRAPSGKEAEYFLALAFEEGNFLTDDGLNNDNITEQLDNYYNMLNDSKAMSWYNQSKQAIEKARTEYSSKALSDIRKLQKQEIKNNQTRFKGDYVERPVNEQSFDPSKYINRNTLVDTSWLYNNAPKTKVKGTGTPKKTYNPNTNTFQ